MKDKQEILTTGGDIQSPVKCFFQGVVASQYELKLIKRIINRDGSNRAYVIERIWNESQVLKSFQFLYRKNQESFNIYIRPLDNRFVLLDDLTREVLESLAEIKPCLLMETSPGNFQAWIKLEKAPSERSELLNIWRSIANEFNADPGSAKPDQIGRLPGFFNRKEKYRPNYPFVKLHRFQDRTSSYKYSPGSSPPVVNNSIQTKKRTGRDRSAFDFALACSLIEKNWTEDKIKEYILMRSEKAQERGERYLNQTIVKAKRKILG